MTNDELIETLKAIAWPETPDPHAGKTLAEITEAAQPPKREIANDLVEEAIRQICAGTVEERWALIRRWVAEIPKVTMIVLNNAMTTHPTKKHEFWNALKELRETQPADDGKPKVGGHSRDASSRYNALLNKITNEKHLQFIGDMNRTDLVVYLMVVHDGQTVVPAVHLRAPDIEEKVRAATTVPLICYEGYIYPEWTP